MCIKVMITFAGFENKAVMFSLLNNVPRPDSSETDVEIRKLALKNIVEKKITVMINTENVLLKCNLFPRKSTVFRVACANIKAIINGRKQLSRYFMKTAEITNVINA